MMTVDEIFADDRRNPPSERSLPWEESRGGVTVVVEPKPHWAEDMRAFRLDAREYCRYADWTAHVHSFPTRRSSDRKSVV